jgi:hypothetical protein
MNLRTDSSVGQSSKGMDPGCLQSAESSSFEREDIKGHGEEEK